MAADEIGQGGDAIVHELAELLQRRGGERVGGTFVLRQHQCQFHAHRFVGDVALDEGQAITFRQVDAGIEQIAQARIVRGTAGGLARGVGILAIRNHW